MDDSYCSSTNTTKRFSSPKVKLVMATGVTSPSATSTAAFHLNHHFHHRPSPGASFRSTLDTSTLMQPQQPPTTATRNTLSTIPQSRWITETPSNNQSMVLLSPSRTITDSLNSLASSTALQLEEIWDLVGYSAEDRASQLSEWLVQFKNLCQAKISEETKVAETFQQTIVESKQEIARLCQALQITTNTSIVGFDQDGQEEILQTTSATSSSTARNTATTLTLMDRLATLEATLEGLRSAAHSIQQELVSCRDYLVEAHDALGIDLDPKWRDVDSDLTTARQEEFVRKKEEMSKELATRTSAVIQLVRDCQHVMNDLRIKEDNVDEEGECRFTELDKRIAGSIVRGKDGSFVMASKYRSATCVGISSKALEELTKRFAELHTEKRRRKAKLQEMGAEIAVLWEKLKVPEDDQRAFTLSVQGLGMDTIMKGQAELDRLRVLKSAMLGNLVEEARSTIVSLWEQMNYPQDHRRAFEPFSSTCFHDELLEQHEEYIGVLHGRLEHMKPILRLIERREDIVRERMEYEELQKDPDRLKQRGAALTRQLMEEEKMARRIKKDLPRLTDLMVEKLVEWKQEQSEDFMYDGQVYLEVMDEQEEEWQRYKELEQQRKLKKKQEESVDQHHRVHNPKLMMFGNKENSTKIRQQHQQPRPHDVAADSLKPIRGFGEKQQSTNF